MHGRIGILGFICLSIVGCTETTAPAPAEHEEQEAPLARSFDSATTGTIRGRVVWYGDIPIAKETLVRAVAFNPYLHKNPARYLTPHFPKVEPNGRGVANAVVFLRGIDPARSKAWDHPPASIEFVDRNLLVRQGKEFANVGFVHCGGAIAIVNRDAEYHNLRARGAAFFGMPLIAQAQTHKRKLTQAGIVDLTCAAGYYWLHAHLFVVDHPYYVRTDAAGEFTLAQVPAGTYELVCWLPSWHVVRKEADPETAITARLIWAEPKEQTQRITLLPSGASDVIYRWTSAAFDQK